MPLLDLASRAASQHGWTMRQVWWDYTEMSAQERVAWAGRHLADAVGDHAGRVLVVAKSLGCNAAAAAVERGYDAVWLTPVLTNRLVADPLRRAGSRQLVVGGTGDHLWDPDVARTLPGDVLEVPDADHALAVDGDVVRTAEVWADLARRLDAWLGGMG